MPKTSTLARHSQFHYYLVSICRKVGVFHADYQLMLQSTGNQSKCMEVFMVLFGNSHISPLLWGCGVTTRSLGCVAEGI